MTFQKNLSIDVMIECRREYRKNPGFYCNPLVMTNSPIYLALGQRRRDVDVKIVLRSQVKIPRYATLQRITAMFKKRTEHGPNRQIHRKVFESTSKRGKFAFFSEQNNKLREHHQSEINSKVNSVYLHLPASRTPTTAPPATVPEAKLHPNFQRNSINALKPI